MFSECLELTEATTYDSSDSQKTTIDMLQDFARYKTISFTAKKDFTFSQFSYSYKGESESGKSFDITTDGSSVLGSRKIETPKASNSLNAFTIKDTERTDFWTVRQSTLRDELLIMLGYDANTTIESQMEVKQGEKITLNFGEIKHIYAIGQYYNVSMSFYNFTIA